MGKFTIAESDQDITKSLIELLDYNQLRNHLLGLGMTVFLMRLVALATFHWETEKKPVPRNNSNQLASSKLYNSTMGQIVECKEARINLAIVGNLINIPGLSTIPKDQRPELFQQTKLQVQETGPAKFDDDVDADNYLIHMRRKSFGYRGVHQSGPIYNPGAILSNSQGNWENYDPVIPDLNILINNGQSELAKELHDINLATEIATRLTRKLKTETVIFSEKIGVDQTKAEMELVETGFITINRKSPEIITNVDITKFSETDPIDILLHKQAIELRESKRLKRVRNNKKKSDNI